jgi:virulence-associated protein VapD
VPRQGVPPAGSQRREEKEEQMYAIAFELDADRLRLRYPSAPQNAYDEIRKVLFEHGFVPKQGNLQFGGQFVTPVTCVLVVQEMARRLEWFAACLSDIRMLRIADDFDLRPAVEAALKR